MASYDQFVPVFNRVLAHLKRIEKNTLCLACADEGGVSAFSVPDGEDEENPISFGQVANLAALDAGSRYVLITKTSANTDTITITGGGDPIVVTEPGVALELPVLPSGGYPQINIASADGATWTVKYLA